MLNSKLSLRTIKYKIGCVGFFLHHSFHSGKVLVSADKAILNKNSSNCPWRKSHCHDQLEHVSIELSGKDPVSFKIASELSKLSLVKVYIFLFFFLGYVFAYLYKYKSCSTRSSDFLEWKIDARLTSMVHKMHCQLNLHWWQSTISFYTLGRKGGRVFHSSSGTFIQELIYSEGIGHFANCRFHFERSRRSIMLHNATKWTGNLNIISAGAGT